MRYRVNIQSIALIVGSLVFVGSPAQADAPTGHFANAVGGTVLDTKTQLIWQQTAPTIGGNDGAGNYTWVNVKGYCNSLSLNGMTGWRVPTVKELASLVDLTKQAPPFLDLHAFPGAKPDFFWSATPLAGEPGFAWYVSFDNGYTTYDTATTAYRVRCVH